MGKEKEFTITIYIEDSIGLLNKIVAVFSRHNINIDCLTTSRSEITEHIKLIVVVEVQENLIKKIINRLEKQVGIIKAFYHTSKEIIFREAALFKISDKYLFDELIQLRILHRKLKIISFNQGFFVAEKLGDKEEIDNLVKELQQHGLIQVVRSGQISVTKPKMSISGHLDISTK